MNKSEVQTPALSLIMGSIEATTVISQINPPSAQSCFLPFLPQAGIDLNNALIQLALEQHGFDLFELCKSTYTWIFPMTHTVQIQVIQG